MNKVTKEEQEALIREAKFWLERLDGNQVVDLFVANNISKQMARHAVAKAVRRMRGKE